MSDRNNGNMPANPVRGADGVPFNKSDYHGTTNMMSGLTKREAFAMAAMQGILSSKYYGEFCTESRTKNTNVESCADMAILHADALLKELSNVQT